jgi:hypothetical protein
VAKTYGHLQLYKLRLVYWSSIFLSSKYENTARSVIGSCWYKLQCRWKCIKLMPKWKCYVCPSTRFKPQIFKWISIVRWIFTESLGEYNFGSSRSSACDVHSSWSYNRNVIYCTCKKVNLTIKYRFNWYVKFYLEYFQMFIYLYIFDYLFISTCY